MHQNSTDIDTANIPVLGVWGGQAAVRLEGKQAGGGEREKVAFNIPPPPATTRSPHQQLFLPLFSQSI